jgi:uncharacterized phage protein gp47/JayE
MADTAFKKDYPTLVENRLTDFDNEWKGCDTSAGSAVNVSAETGASPEWGLYKEMDRIAKQIFPDTSDTERLNHHGTALGLPRLEDESDAEYLARILARLRNPPAGGNLSDFEAWIKAVEYEHETYAESVDEVFIHENARGEGGTNIVVTSSRTIEQGGEEETTDELLGAIADEIEEKRPVGIWDYLVLAPVKKTQAVEVDVTGDCNTAKAETDIAAYMKGLEPGKTFYRSQIQAICINNGADDAEVTTPATDVTVKNGPLEYERIWPDTVTVEEA